jgi:hypothetical protein
MKKSLWRAKLGAFGLHILFSATIIGVFMIMVTQFWFPGALFSFENVWEGLRILIPVDAILGPLLTLIIFVPGKKGLKFDLSVIASLQIAALIYGGWSIYGARPEVIAWVGDRFEVVTASSYDKSKFPAQEFKPEHQGYPLMVYPLPAQTDEELSKFVRNNVQYQLIAERYRPLATHIDVVMERAMNIDFIKPETAEEIAIFEQFKKTFDPEKEALFRLQSTTRDFMILVLDTETLTISGYLELDPWEVYQPSTTL